MLNLVADLSHYNTNPDDAHGVLNFRQAYQDGLRAVLHKATEGTGLPDGQYAARRPQALQAGLLWGAYHFGRPEDGAAQAAHFLAHAGADAHTLLVLDFEQSRTGGLNMTTAQAEAFVRYVWQHTGRYPGLYSDPAYLQLTQAHRSPVLRRCWLWLASYAPTEEPPLPPGWPHWTLWQYTDGRRGRPPHTVRGLGPCDRDMFNGQPDDLRQLWGYPPAPLAAADEAEAGAGGAGTGAGGADEAVAPATPPAPPARLPAALGALQGPALRFGLTLLTSLPITQVLHGGLGARLRALTAGLRPLAGHERALLLVLVLAGCYLARRTAAYVQALAAPPA